LRELVRSERAFCGVVLRGGSMPDTYARRVDIVELSAEVSTDCSTCERAADPSLRKRAM
jgi:hypothetical protein